MSHERRFHAAEFTGGFGRDMQLPEQEELSVKTGLNSTCYVECYETCNITRCQRFAKKAEV